MFPPLQIKNLSQIFIRSLSAFVREFASLKFRGKKTNRNQFLFKLEESLNTLKLSEILLVIQFRLLIFQMAKLAAKLMNNLEFK
jgi:hypothetical protein